MFINKNIHVELHPAAKAMYEWCMQYPQWINWIELPQPIITGLSKEPIRGVMIKEDESDEGKKLKRHFQLYSPLWSTQLWSSTRPPSGTLLVSLSPKEISDEEVETATWLSALSPLLLSVNPHQIAEIRDALTAHMPIKVHQKLLRAPSWHEATPRKIKYHADVSLEGCVFSETKVISSDLDTKI